MARTLAARRTLASTVDAAAAGGGPGGRGGRQGGRKTKGPKTTPLNEGAEVHSHSHGPKNAAKLICGKGPNKCDVLDIADHEGETVVVKLDKSNSSLLHVQSEGLTHNDNHCANLGSKLIQLNPTSTDGKAKNWQCVGCGLVTDEFNAHQHRICNQNHYHDVVCQKVFRNLKGYRTHVSRYRELHTTNAARYTIVRMAATPASVVVSNKMDIDLCCPIKKAKKVVFAEHDRVHEIPARPEPGQLPDADVLDLEGSLRISKAQFVKQEEESEEGFKQEYEEGVAEQELICKEEPMEEVKEGKNVVSDTQLVDSTDSMFSWVEPDLDIWVVEPVKIDTLKLDSDKLFEFAMQL